MTTPNPTNPFGSLASEKSITPDTFYGNVGITPQMRKPIGKRNTIDAAAVRRMDKKKIEAVQADLKGKGLYKGNIDGIYGPLTEAAIKGYNAKRPSDFDVTLPEVSITPQKEEVYNTSDLIISDAELAKHQDIYAEKLAACKGAEGCLAKANAYYNKYVAPIVNRPDSWGELSGFSPDPNYNIGNSVDSWDIHGALRQQGGTAIPIEGKELNTRVGGSETVKKLNLPIGTKAGMGNASGLYVQNPTKEAYNTKVGAVPSSHTATLVSYTDKGESIWSDMGKLVKTEDLLYSGINNLTVPKGNENLTFDNIISGKIPGAYVPQVKESPTAYKYAGTPANPGEFNDFQKALFANRSKWATQLGMSEAEYNEMAKKSLAMAITETDGGDNLARKGGYMLDKATNFLPAKLRKAIGVGSSQGLTQISDYDLFNTPQTAKFMRRLGITEDKYDPYNPEHIAAASIVMGRFNTSTLANVPNKNNLTENQLYSYKWNQGSIKESAKGDSIHSKKFQKAYDMLEETTIQDLPKNPNSTYMGKPNSRSYAYGGNMRRRTNYSTGGPEENPQLFDFLLQQGGVTSPSSESVAAKTGAGPVSAPSKFDKIGGALSGLSGLASLAGPVGMGVAAVAPIAIPAIMKGIESIANMNKEPKVISASPGNYASGGDMDLSSTAFQVKGNPGEVDGNSYQTPNGPVNLDHNEVVKENFVFSNRLKDPVTGKKFSELAKKIENSNAKAEKALRANPDDTTAMNTLKLNVDLSKQVAARQEQLATMKGLRDTPTNSFWAGTPPGGGWPNPFTFFASIPGAVSNALKTEPLKNPYMPPGDQWSYQRSSNGRVVKAYAPEGYKMQSTEFEGLYKDPIKGGYVKRNGENGYYYPVNYTPPRSSTPATTSSTQTPAALPFPDASTWLGTPVAESPYIATVSEDRSPAAVAKAKAKMGIPATTKTNSVPNPYGLTVDGQTPYVFDDGKPIPPKPVPEHAVLPLMALPTRGFQEQVPGGAPNALSAAPQYVTPNKSLAERGMQQYKDAASSDLTSGANKTNAVRPYQNRFTIGDAIQAGTAASKFLSLIGGPEQETAQLDNSRITQRYFDVDPLLQTSRSSQANALNRFGSAPTNVRGAVANQLLATRLNADNQALSQYEQMNQQAINQYEQAVGNQRRFNVGQINYTNDLNARNRGQFDTNLDVAFNTLGNFGIGLNQKQQGTDAMNLMSTMYKDVAARIFSMLQEEELKKKKEETKK